MSTPKMPDGSDAWFVRKRTRKGFAVQPCSAMGWTATIAFVFANLVFGVALSFFAMEPSAPLMIGIVTLFVVALILYLVLVFRMSVRLP